MRLALAVLAGGLLLAGCVKWTSEDEQESEETSTTAEQQLSVDVSQKNLLVSDWTFLVDGVLIDALMVPDVLSAEPLENGNAVKLSGVQPEPLSTGETNAISFKIPDEVEQAVSGSKIRVDVLAKSTGSETPIAVAYSTNEVGNSYWRSMMATDQFQVMSFTYDVPPMAEGRGDFIGILPDYHDIGEGIVLLGLGISIVPNATAPVETTSTTSSVVSPDAEPLPD